MRRINHFHVRLNTFITIKMYVTIVINRKQTFIIFPKRGGLFFTKIQNGWSIKGVLLVDFRLIKR